ncbi:MAG: TrkA family potassium uptake protein [Halobacteriales archaeon]|nr:TrkA family potassium uptake protein [Halobacteriales archaeon]
MSQDLRVVIVGGGHVGFHTAEHLDRRGHDVVIIESDQERCERLNDAYVATVIEGDGTRPSILEQAQPERSDVVAALIGDATGTNIGICMTAKELAPGIKTLARVDHGGGHEYEGMVDATVFPEKLAAHVAANHVFEITGGGVRTIEEVTDDLELIEIEVTEDAPAAGKRFSEIRFPDGSLVIQRQGDDRLASGESVLTPGERYILATKPESADELVRLLRG